MILKETEEHISICAWCPDKKEQEEKAEIKGLLVSHSICEQCYKTEMEVINILD